MDVLEVEKMEIPQESDFKKYLPIKAHYFVLMSATSSTIPYIFIYAKQLGITADVLGYITAAIWVTTVISRPIIGGLADYFDKKFKFLLIFLILFNITTNLGLSLIPQPEKESSLNSTTNSSVVCYHNNSYLIEIEANSCGKCCLLPYSLEEVNSFDCGNKSFSLLSENLKEMPLECSKDYIIKCLEGAFGNNCSNVTGNNVTDISPFLKQNGVIQVSLFGIFVTVFFVALTALETLTDTACAKNLGDKLEEFGKQRMWGTIGWAIFAFGAGALNHAFSVSDNVTNYIPGFYLSLTFYVLDIIVLWKLKLLNPKSPRNIFKKVAWLLLKPRIIIFILEVIAIGMLRGLYMTYSLWYLENIGASPLLLGSITSAQCFLGEIPFLFISGWLIQKIGHLNVFTMAFIAYGLRFFAYAFLVNPWWGILIEVLQGPSFGSFYAGLTSYGKLLAPVGAEATIQGISLAAMDGIGTSVGSVIGGHWVHNLGGRETFFQAGIWSFIFGMVSCILNAFIMCNLIK